MVKATLKYSIIVTFLLAGMNFIFAQEETEKPPENPPRLPHHDLPFPPAFVDLDGDGFNDLAPDDDGDGIPNRIDPDFTGPQDRIRWGWFRSMPDSARYDSLRFREWWRQVDRRPIDWREAWQRWFEIRESGGPWHYRDQIWRERFNPRDRRFREEIRRRREAGGDERDNGRGGRGRRRGGRGGGGR